MIYRHNRRLIVQKPATKSKYVLSVVSAMTDHTYPFNIPSASIEVIANDGQGLYDFISDIEFDDIVRLQVSNTYSETEKEVWTDIFQGRIISQKSQWGKGTTATPMCVGHIHQASYFDIPATYNTTSADAGTIAANWNSSGLDRIQVTSPVTPTFSMPYSVTKDKKYLKDVLSDIESTSGYGYYFNAVPAYDTALNLVVPTTVEFRQLPATATTKYEVRQGSPRLLSANFTVSGENLYNQVIYYGATVNETQASGVDTDSASIAQYSTRTYVGTDNSLTAGDCTAFASGLIEYTHPLKITGTVELLGTPEAKIGDLVNVYVQNADVIGAGVDTNTMYSSGLIPNPGLRVVRVSHNLGQDDFTTTLQFGQVQKGPSDYIAQFMNSNRKLCNMFIN